MRVFKAAWVVLGVFCAVNAFRVDEATGGIIHARGDEEPDYSCGPAKPCELGCCGPPPFGFCGVTDDFCQGRKTASPECAIADGTSDKRTVGYYEGWNLARSCGTMAPKDIPLGWYAHLNFAFALIHPTTFHVAPMDSETPKQYDAVTSLKERQPGLEVWIAIGGWAMNDEGLYRTAFSDMASSNANKDIFFESLIKFMEEHNFDGVDIDWEYPVASDRGGIPADFDSYATFLRRLRERLNRTGKRYGISIAIPASYWYLRGFNLQELEPWIDWFNIMTYDIHGTWDSHVRAGACTGTPCVLSAAEINEILDNGGVQNFYPNEAVQVVTWDTDQWVSWDDAVTLKMKMDFANRRCLGGTMVWAIDLDDGTLIEALASNLNRTKAKVYPEQHYSCNFGTPHIEDDHDEL
ncbi:hypothetical protein OQA88_2025 [Cercophora sp. LCS_1]